jgi:hypothetical protein
MLEKYFIGEILTFNLFVTHFLHDLQESIERFTEHQAFLRSYDSAPHPPPSLVARQKVVSLSQSSCVSPVEPTNVGGGAKSYDREKAWPSINHSIRIGFDLYCTLL